MGEQRQKLFTLWPIEGFAKPMLTYGEKDSAVEVKAIMLVGDNAEVISDWAHAVVVEEIDPFDPAIKSPGLNVQCGDTVKRASLGDYVLKHQDGTYDVKKQFEFMSNYMLLS